jgi:hypothetical protein
MTPRARPPRHPTHRLSVGTRRLTPQTARRTRFRRSRRSGAVNENPVEVSMSPVVLNVTFDCRDAGAVVRIWEVVTGHPREQEHQRATTTGVVSRPMGACRGCSSSPCPRESRSRTECIWTCCRTTRARKKRSPASSTSARPSSTTRRRSNPGGWIVMADPECNEFCVEDHPI